ncbi:MAG: hypothetical protein A2148_00405 [Chloroflexi bacterium RBG_16_68_14]|nr:MAG: hypothetical protein A2148_00405 [Chloroflexi bacterium RBG_16_68_14]
MMIRPFSLRGYETARSSNVLLLPQLRQTFMAYLRFRKSIHLAGSGSYTVITSTEGGYET